MHKYTIDGFEFVNSTSNKEVFSATHLEDKSKKPEFYRYCILKTNPDLEILTDLQGVNNRDEIQVFCKIHKKQCSGKILTLLNCTPCKECGMNKQLTTLNTKVAEELQQLKDSIPKNISFNMDEALSAGGYDKKFTAICEEHGVFKTSRRQIKASKFVCKNCAARKCERRDKTKSKGKFMDYIASCGRGYDYSLVDYAGTGTKVKIICKTHGVFLQTPYGHMQGYDCPKCGILKGLSKKISLGYGNNFGRSSYTNPTGLSFVYVFKVYSENEIFYKIGITKDIQTRQKDIEKDSGRYSTECIFKFHTDCTSAWDIEKVLHYDNRGFRYKPNFKFAGSTECFSTVDIDSIKKISLCCI